MTWIIATSGAKCRIYDYEKHHHNLTLLKEISHPASKMKATDLVTDRPGSFKTKSTGKARSACGLASDPKRLEIDHFAKELADELETGRVNHQYDKLIIVASPQMSGLLNQHLNKHINELMIANIKKDLVNLSDKALKNFLRDNWLEITNSKN